MTKRYGSGDAAVDALRGVSVDFPKGQFAAVMGPSGSGKSTLMNILAGLDAPTSGSVVIDGTEITTLKDKPLTLLRREKVGFVFQFFNLLPMLTAEENLELPMAIAGRKIDREWEQSLVGAVGLGDRRRHRPSELSGGQQQRVALARGLISRPGRPVRRRAHRQPRLVDLRRDAGAAAALGGRVRPDDRDGDPRRPRGRGAPTACVFLRDGEIVEDHGHLEADEVYDVVKSLEQA